jgi:hypothetical protein
LLFDLAAAAALARALGITSMVRLEVLAVDADDVDFAVEAKEDVFCCEASIADTKLDVFSRSAWSAQQRKKKLKIFGIGL